VQTKSPKPLGFRAVRTKAQQTLPGTLSEPKVNAVKPTCGRDHCSFLEPLTTAKPKKQKTADLTLRFAWTRSARTVVTPGEPMDAKNKSKERCCSFAGTVETLN
jgi:hypothetical protein